MDFDVQKFARLARLKLAPRESKKLEKDLAGILDHFKELGQVDTKNTKPMTGGTSLINIFREDEIVSERRAEGGDNQFPEETDGYLKTPKVFN